MATTYTCVRDGRIVAADEALDARGILRDGYGMRAPMLMLDALQRSVAGDRKVQARDPMGREAGTYEEEEPDEDDEPRRKRKRRMGDAFTDSRGVAFAADARLAAAQRAVDHLQGRDEMLRQMYRDGRSTSHSARQNMITDGTSAWDAKPPPAGAYPYSAAAEGNPCTIDGAPGTLQKRGDALICVPNRKSDRPGAHDARPVLGIKQQAYDEMVRAGEDAWKEGNR